MTKKLTVGKAKKDFAPKREKKIIEVVNEAGEKQSYWIEVDSRFLESKKIDLASELILNLVYEDENQEYKFTLEEKQMHLEAYIIGLCLKHFTSLDIDGNYEEMMDTIRDFVDAGIWTDVVKTMDENQVGDVFVYIENFLAKNNENINIAIEQAKADIQNDELLAQFDFVNDEIEEEADKDEAVTE